MRRKTHPVFILTRVISRAFVCCVGLFGPLLACNLTSTPDAPPTPDDQSVTTLAPDAGAPPQVVIESPADGSQAVLRQVFNVRVRAQDGIGVTLVVMTLRAADGSRRVVVTQPSPDPSRSFEALLPYAPTETGRITLEVIAYRREVGSVPATLNVDVVGSVAELRNPGSLDPTAGVASGAAICTATVNVNNLNLRGGPGTQFSVITKLGLGEALNVIGRNGDMTWLKIRRTSGGEGWVSAQYVTQDGDCSRAPVSGG